jgi:hypothetical protein
LKQVDAVLGSVGVSLQYTGAATGEGTKKQNDQAVAVRNVQAALGEQNTALTEAKAKQKELADAVAGGTAATAAQEQATKSLAANYGMSVSEMLAAKAAQQTNADQAAATTHQLQMENDAVTLLQNAFTLLNKANLDIAQVQTAAAAATNTLTDSLTQNGLQIDGNSKAAVSNQQALQQKALADQAASTAVQQLTGSTEQGAAAFAASKQALMDQLKASGQLTPAIQALIDKYYEVPTVVKTQVSMDADAAIAKAASLKAVVESIRDRTITLTVQTNAAGAPVQMPANTASPIHPYMTRDGGTVHAATGLTVPGGGSAHEDSVHMLLAPSEEVISNHRGQADRFRPVLKAINSGASPDDVAGMFGGRSHGDGNIIVTVVNKTGVSLADLIDIRVARSNARQALGISTGKQKVAY